VPAAGELRIDKRYNSSLEATALDEQLAALGTTRIVLADAATNWCIRAIDYGALERGYDLTLVSDAHTTKSIPLKDGAQIEAAGIAQELNNAMGWLSYPGRTNGTSTAEAFYFAAPGGMR
jgi:nicotinamidase-related amidase